MVKDFSKRALGREVPGLMARVRQAAQRRGQDASTAHLLLVMVQGRDEASRALSARGVSEMDVLAALRKAADEPASALEMAVERACRVADSLGSPHPRGIHLLIAITKESRCAGYRCLERMGASAAGVREQALALLGVEQAGARTRTGTYGPSSPGGTGSTWQPATGGAAKQRSAARRSVTVTTAPSTDKRTSAALKQARSHTTARAPAAETNQENLASKNQTVAQAATEPTPVSEKRTSSKTAKRKNSRRSLTAVDCEDRVERAHAEGALDPNVFPILSKIGKNLTQLALAGRIDRVVGRDAEIEQMLDILARRKANNPVLVGPSGVGKTSIVEGLALRLAQRKEGVTGLDDRCLIEIPVGSLISGTGVRGALSERMRQVCQEVERSQGKVILFFDEMHAVMGGSEGPGELANELKGALGRGQITCIGATTETDYRRYLEQDPGLARRFSNIEVGEPSEGETLTILERIKSHYEGHHEVQFHEAAIQAAVELSVRYLPDLFLPDKAISTLDLAAARVRRRGGSEVDAAAVATVISERTRVPTERLLMKDTERLLQLEELLAERIVGQPVAIQRVSDALRKGAAGLRGQRPLATFMLLGPTGVGKTEMAKAVSEILFPGGAVTRLDMSEFSEAHAVARLLGAPPGYVGHEDGGQLTEAVRKRPYQLVLLDEIEKAHRDVLLALLPLLDEGHLTDGRGRTVDFSNTVVMMTSNLGSQGWKRNTSIGFGDAGDQQQQQHEHVIEKARVALAPELWNRIDEPIAFSPLDQKDTEEIALRMLDQVAVFLHKSHRIVVEIDPSALSALVAAGGYDPQLGARPMRRTIGRLVESPLASKILAGEIGESSHLRVYAKDNCIAFETLTPAAA